MLKKILIVLGIIFGLILLIVVFAKIYFKPSKEVILKFIKENPNKASIKLIRNGKVLVDRNSNIKMPLASTVKIILAIEYAEQAANKIINPEKLISLEELNKYYIPKTDGGAHKRWLASIKSKIETEKIPLKEIAKGMMKYSSNANTEWLSEKLGLDNIKITNQIHEKLKTDQKYKERLGDVGLGTQHVWSDNLPQSTVREYVGLMQKLNSKTYLSKNVHKYLDEILETIMESKGNQKWLEYAGMKGGSTAFVLTKSMYATDKKNNKTELSYFINDLDIFENRRISGSMNEFELNLLTDEDFVTKIQNELEK